MASFDAHTKPESTALLGVIEDSPFTVTCERRSELVRRGVKYWGVSSYFIGAKTGKKPNVEDTYFCSRGLNIRLVPSIRTNGRSEVDIHFVPQSDTGNFYSKPNLKHGLKFMLDGITAAQDYCLLVEAGYIPAPQVLVGITNTRLALLAKRFGFKDDVEAPYYGLETVDNEVDIFGTYEDFKVVALGDDMARKSEVLAARLHRDAVAMK